MTDFHPSNPPQRSNAAMQDIPDWLPAAGGAALVLLALTRKRTLFGLGALLGGGYLLYRAVENGTIKLPKDLDSLGLPPDLVERFRQEWQNLGGAPPAAQTAAARGRSSGGSTPDEFDSVDEASMESFPGSDPPSKW